MTKQKLLLGAKNWRYIIYVEKTFFVHCYFSGDNIVIGNPILGSANGNYGKHISGVTQVSTQSESYNMETIHVFVTYAHTTITIRPGVNVSLTYKKAEGIITFEPRVTQSVMAKGDHTFRYNAQGDIVA